MISISLQEVVESLSHLLRLLIVAFSGEYSAAFLTIEANDSVSMFRADVVFQKRTTFSTSIRAQDFPFLNCHLLRLLNSSIQSPYRTGLLDVPL